MLGYCFKRVLIFVPTLLIICLFSFYININAPGDPVLRLLNISDASDMQSKNGISNQMYNNKRRDLGLDLPVFYFSINTLAHIDLRDIVLNKNQCMMLERWAIETGAPKETKMLYILLSNIKRSYLNEKKYLDTIKMKYSVLNIIDVIFNKTSWLDAEKEIETLYAMNLDKRDKSHLISVLGHINKKQNVWKRYVPIISIHGTNSQFHLWLCKLLSGDMGISYIDKRPVLSKLKDAISFTLPLSIMSIILTFLLSVPIGVYSAVKRNSFFDKLVGLLLFILYSIPSFWFASMIMVFLGDPDSPIYMSWFEPLGFKQFSRDTPFVEWLQIMFSHIWVPLFCLTYFNIAFVSKQMRGAMLESFNQDYIRTAYAKGLSNYVIVWKHAFRNSLLPIITMLGGLFPFAIGGAIVLEIIFSIPGMGWLTIEAFFGRDYPVIIGVVFFSGLLTLVGYLFSDVSYVIADPRIRFGKRNLVS